MSATEDAIALLRSRVSTQRIGKMAWREMDQDIIAMRKVIELLEQEIASASIMPPEEQRIAFAEWLDDFHGNYVTEGGCDFHPWRYQNTTYGTPPGPAASIVDPILERARR